MILSRGRTPRAVAAQASGAHIAFMAKRSKARTEPLQHEPQPQDEGAEVVDLDGVAERQARFLAYASAARPAACYYFAFPSDAMVVALGDPTQRRSAVAQLELALALTGGGLAKAGAGVLARVPLIAAARFEALAGPLIEGFLVAFDRGAFDAQPRRPADAARCA